MKNKYKSIIIEGPIGVGKTTLATKLASSSRKQAHAGKFF